LTGLRQYTTTWNWYYKELYLYVVLRYINSVNILLNIDVVLFHSYENGFKALLHLSEGEICGECSELSKKVLPRAGARNKKNSMRISLLPAPALVRTFFKPYRAPAVLILHVL
jgi:hypothetical protein